MKVSAIIPAAGLGNRFGEAKQFKLLAGHALFVHSIKIFLNFSKIDEIVLVAPKDKKNIIYDELAPISKNKNIVVTNDATLPGIFLIFPIPNNVTNKKLILSIIF